MVVSQRCTTFLGQGPQCITFSALEGGRQSNNLNIRKSSVKNGFFIYFTNLFHACSLILMLSELFLIIISCKIANRSMKFKFVHKIAVIQKKFLLPF